MKKSIPLSNQKILTISQPEPEDASEILAYLCQVGGETPYLTFGAEGLPLTVDQEAQFIQACQYGDAGIMLKGVVEGKIVATGTLTRSSRPRVSHIGEMGISVLRAWWRLGICRAMMTEMIDWAKQHGVLKVDLRVHEQNSRAITIYEKFGFEKEGFRRLAFREQNKFHDELLMGLCL